MVKKDFVPSSALYDANYYRWARAGTYNEVRHWLPAAYGYEEDMLDYLLSVNDLQGIKEVEQNIEIIKACMRVMDQRVHFFGTVLFRYE